MSEDGNAKVNMEMHQMARELIANSIVTRSEFIRQVIDGGGKDLNTDCGYPDSLKASDYQNMYAREGVGARVVDVWPEESWSSPPLIYETEDPEQVTEFERLWNTMDEELGVLSLLARADKLSGVGQYGIILLGLDDGKTLDQPIEGVDIRGTGRAEGGVTRKLLYLRTFQESVLEITGTELDSSNPRFGQPTEYKINFSDGTNQFAKKVHWTRVVHLADNREMSEVYGTPRMQKSYNRLLDVRKVMGGSGEMFWKGGFPGLSFEVNGDNDGIELDTDSLRDEMQNYMLGLQRYLALEGVTAKSLAPQVADPEHHLEVQLNAIAIGEGIPKRILFGSEQGELASSQDMRTWHRRLRKRQEGYLTPMVVRPFVDRLIAVGTLPVVEQYFVEWPDISTQTDQEKADVAAKWAEALAKFVAGSVDAVVPIEEFLSIFGNMESAQVKQIMEALDQMIAEEEALTPRAEFTEVEETEEEV